MKLKLPIFGYNFRGIDIVCPASGVCIYTVATTVLYGTVADEVTVPSIVYVVIYTVLCVSVSGIGAFKTFMPFRGEILA